MKCHDHGCDKRKKCGRYTGEPWRGKPDGLPSLFPYDLSLEEDCPFFVKKGEWKGRKEKGLCTD
jgi:hypothetical protein